MDIQTYLAQKLRPLNNQQEKRTCQFVDILVPVEHRVKIKGKQKEKQLFASCQGVDKAVQREGDNDVSCS